MCPDTTEIKTYKVVRKFAYAPDELREFNLTLAEAKAICKDPETSSRTCSNETGIAVALKCGSVGPWFDGWEEE